VRPALASAWVVVTLIWLLRTRQLIRAWLVAGVIAIGLASPWSLRNLATFGKLIPTKSNLGYEMYLANVVDDDGIYDNATLLSHPLLSAAERFDYSRLGEVAFVSSRRERFQAAITLEPRAFAERVGRRLLAATVLYAPSERELNGPLWRALQRVVYAMPIGLALMGIWMRGRQRAVLGGLGLLVALALAPYVLIAFYSRYVFPLTPLLIVIWFLGLDALVGQLRQVRAAPAGSAHSPQ
jgi:hypothetical protein